MDDFVLVIRSLSASESFFKDLLSLNSLQYWRCFGGDISSHGAPVILINLTVLLFGCLKLEVESLRYKLVFVFIQCVVHTPLVKFYLCVIK